MLTAGPSIAVVIPCRNEASSVSRLLDSVAAQTRQPDEIVAVDDGSTDGTADVIRAWSSTHAAIPISIASTGGRGAAAAMNAGIALSRASIIARLDGHCRPNPDYIQRGLETLEAPGAGVAGGTWRIEAGANTSMARGIAAVLSHPLGSGGAQYRRLIDRSGIRRVDTVPFGVFKKELWTALGGFDESLLRNQDYDFNYRARLRGYDVLLNPAIRSTYYARPSLGGLASQYFAYGFWKIVMLRRSPAAVRQRQLLPILLPPVLLAVMTLGIVATSQAFWALAVYAGLNAAGAIQACRRKGVQGAWLFGLLALMTLQIAWSTGAWAAIIKGGRVPRG